MMKFAILKFCIYHLTRFFKWLMYAISFCLWLVIVAYLWLGFKLIEGTKWLFSNTQRFVVLLILFFTGITLAGILPATHNFEGQLTVQEMNFTYAGDNSNKLFLNSIRRVNQVSVGGIQTLTLTGNFTSKTYPQLNKLNALTIQLPNETSKWIISPANPQETSQIELMELRLQPNTDVQNLIYNSYRYKNAKINRLSLLLQPPETARKICNSLQLDLGNKPLKLQLEDYRLPQLKLPRNSRELEIIFKPDIPEIRLPLRQRTDLSIDLPDPTQTESSQWLRGDLEVKDVKFYRNEQTGVDVNDELSNSTIIAGKIRMAGQERNIESNQFLIVENPGVKLIRNIQIKSEANPGLEVRISGQTNRLEIGLDSRFPVVTLQASWLDKILPRDAIIALISFSAASFSYLLYWLVDRSAKSNQNQ